MKLGFNEANDRFCKNHSVMMDLELCEKYGFDCIDIQSECLNRDLEAGKITLEEMGAWFQSHHLKMLSYNALCFFNMKQTQEEKDAVMAELDEIIRRCDILSNATRVGMAPDVERSVITDQSCFRPELVVTDVVYAPPETKLLQDARAAGCKTCDGLGMLLCQGAEAFRLYSGLEMPIEEIKELLYT